MPRFISMTSKISHLVYLASSRVLYTWMLWFIDDIWHVIITSNKQLPKLFKFTLNLECWCVALQFFDWAALEKIRSEDKNFYLLSTVSFHLIAYCTSHSIVRLTKCVISSKMSFRSLQKFLSFHTWKPCISKRSNFNTKMLQIDSLNSKLTQIHLQNSELLISLINFCRAFTLLVLLQN